MGKFTLWAFKYINMKRSVLLFLSWAALSSYAQNMVQPAYVSTDYGAKYAYAVGADVNGDGHIDLTFAGIGNDTTNYAGDSDDHRNLMSHVALYNPSTGAWSIAGFHCVNDFDSGIGFNVAERPSIAFADFNHDGILDVVAFENVGDNYRNEPFLDHISNVGLFIGTGTGSFQQAALTFVDESGNADSTFSIRHLLAADVADVNNDGLPDIIGIGYQISLASDVRAYPARTVVLINQGNGRFMVSDFLNGDYVKDYGETPLTYHFNEGSVKAYDLNNDGYVDFMVNAKSNDRGQLGTLDGVSNHFTDIFLNDPQHPGHFCRMHLAAQSSTFMRPMSEGSVAIADFNDDGVADLYVSGWTGNGKVAYVSSLYIGSLSDGTLSYTLADVSNVDELRSQNSNNCQYLAFDWSGNGEYDLIAQGLSNAQNQRLCYVYANDGKASFTRTDQLAGSTEGALALTDYDGDGTLDVVSIGRSSDPAFFGSSDITSRLIVTANPHARPARPDAPSLQAPVVNGGLVTLSWADAATSKKNVTYEYYVKDASGNTVFGGNVIIGGTNDGVRKVAAAGNAYNARQITLSLPSGSYTYGVQTVNAALEGSVFATGSFMVSASDVAQKDPAIQSLNELCSSQGRSYENPVLDKSCADPTIIKAHNSNYFYMYATGRHMYSSADLVHWSTLNRSVLSGTPSWYEGKTSGASLWAPDAQYINGQYVLYYSYSAMGEVQKNGVGVATCSRPYMTYTDHGKLVAANDPNGLTNSIDQCYIENDDGRKYLFWGSFYGIDYIELSDDGLSVKEGAMPTRVSGTATEGTYIIKHGDYYYFIGSAGSCCSGANSTYRLVMGRSKSLFGPYVNKLGQRTLDNHFSNLLYRSKHVVGPGHNANWIQDDEGNYWIVYHGYQEPFNGGRIAYIDRIYWDEEGWPYIRNARPSRVSASPVFTNTTGIGEAFIQNPADNDATVTVSATDVKSDFTISKTDEAPFRWGLYDLQGRCIRHGKAARTANVNTDDLPWSVYLLTVKSKTGIYKQKIVKN